MLLQVEQLKLDDNLCCQRQMLWKLLKTCFTSIVKLSRLKAILFTVFFIYFDIITRSSRGGFEKKKQKKFIMEVKTVKTRKSME